MSLTTKEEGLYKYTVSDLVYTIFCEYRLVKLISNEIAKIKTPAMELGDMIHSLLDYNNEIVYECNYKELKIVGKPDKVRYINNYVIVEELKVSEIHNNFKYLYIMAKFQAMLYAYILSKNNFNVKYCSVIILRSTGRCYKIQFQPNYKFVERMLDRVISIHNGRKPKPSNVNYVCNRCDAILCMYRLNV